MEVACVDDAIQLLEKANADLQPELLASADARAQLEAYARAQRLAAFGVATLSRKVDETAEIARTAGTPLGKAKETLATGKALVASPELNDAMQSGWDLVRAGRGDREGEGVRAGAARELVAVAAEQPFHVLKEKARKAKLEAEQHRDLGGRQRAARSARTYCDDLGMVHVHVAFEPHVGTPIVAKAEAEAARLARAAKRSGASEPFEAHLADAYAALLSGSDKASRRRPELVVLVSHEVAKRGWKDGREGQVCKIPGVGPISPEAARAVAADSFLNGVLYDGKDLRNFVRWTRNIPIEVLIALELGEPPAFDGVACVDCGNRFRTEFDHVRPRAARGATSKSNLKPRCWSSVPPAGFEPAHLAPEASALSPELRGRVTTV